LDFIDFLKAEGIPFFFLTNNSQRTNRDVCYKLQRIGFDVQDDDIFTCAVARKN